MTARVTLAQACSIAEVKPGTIRQWVQMPLAALLAQYQDGDEHGWPTEFVWLRSEHSGRLDELAESVQQTGIRVPILLGNDGRVWDGHHRLCVADMLGISEVPIEIVP